MSKNLTRKGLAFGALVALGSSVLAGAPAFAVDTMVLKANGSVDTAILAAPITETFTLNASLGAGSVAANMAQLKWKITPPSGSQVDYTAAGVSPDVTSNTGTAGAAVVVNPTDPTSSSTNTLALSINGAASTDATKTVTVTAFLDTDNNGAFDSAVDTVNKTVDVNFVKYSEITTSTTITSPTAGNTTVSALVKFTNVNGEQLTAKKVGAHFTKGDGNALSANQTAITTLTGVAANGVVTTSAAHGFSVGDVVTIDVDTAADDGTYQITAVTTSSPYTFTIGKVTGTFTLDTSLTATSAARSVVTRSGVAYSTTKGGFSFTTLTLDTALAKNTAVKVQPLLNGVVVNSASGNSIGSAETASVVTRVLGSFTGSHVLSTTAASAAASGTTTAPASGTVTNAVALDTEKKVYFLAKDTTTPTSKVLAGQKVTVTVTSSRALSSTVKLTVAGTEYTSSAALPGYNSGAVAELALTTDADGKAYVTYKTSGFTDADYITFVASSENSTATVIGTETTRVFSKINTTGSNEDVTGRTYIANNEGDSIVTVDGTAAKVDVVVQDQWGGTPADNKFVVSATFDTTTANGYVAQATAASTSATGTYTPVVGGKATLTITDNGTGKGTNLYIVKLMTVAANGVLTETTDTVNTSSTYIANPLKVVIADPLDITGGKIVLGRASFTEYDLNAAETAYIVALSGTVANGAATDKAQLTYSAFKSVDGRAIAVTGADLLALDGSTSTSADALEASNANAGAVTIQGVVSSASTATHAGIAIPGAAVTVAGTNMMFVATVDGQTVSGDGTLTIHADATGSFTVLAYSHVAGKNVVTVTSGTGKALLEAYYKDATEISAAAVTAKVGDGSAQFQAGRALDVTVLVADKFGNPVALTGTAGTTTGKLVIAQTGAGYLSDVNTAGTLTAGKFTSKLITNFGDLGTSNLSATVDFDNSGTLVDLVANVSSEFGITDVTDISSAGKAIYVNTEFAKGKVVTVYINGKRMPVKAAEATDNAVERKYTQRKAGTYTVTVRVSGGVVASEKIVIK